MKKFLPTLAMALVFFSGIQMAQADVMASLSGKKRVLILFDKSRSSASLDRQIDSLRQRRPDLSERDMVVISNPGFDETTVAIGYVSTPRGTNRFLRNRFKPADKGLTLVLVGKDGLEKGRWQKKVQPDEIFKLIDSMPMRKREIRESAATN